MPGEIGKIEIGESANGMLGVDFGAGGITSDAVKIEAKSDRGTYPFELKIPIGESLRPLQLTEEEFAKEAKRLGGFNVSELKLDNVGKGVYDRIPDQVGKVVNCHKVSDGWVGGVCCFSSTTNKGDKVLVKITMDESSYNGILAVHSGDSMLASTLAPTLKGKII